MNGESGEQKDGLPLLCLPKTSQEIRAKICTDMHMAIGIYTTAAADVRSTSVDRQKNGGPRAPQRYAASDGALTKC